LVKTAGCSNLNSTKIRPLDRQNQGPAGINLVTSLIVDSPAKFFYRPAFSFRFENFFLQRGRPWRFAAALLFASGNLSAACDAFSIFDRVEQTFARELAVHRLRSRILDGHADSARPMSQRHCGRNFVYVLTARTARASERFLKIDFAHAQARHSLNERISCHLLAEIDELCNQSATLLRGSESTRRLAGENRIKIGQDVLWSEKL
jgi:hypothetical protein